jgi:AraC family transcriptional regulator of arabinose operon
VDTLLVGHETREPTWTWRPEGTTTPLLVHTLGGAGRVDLGPSGAEHPMTAGDTVVWGPGAAHDFGCRPADASWEIVWAHFRPQPGWPTWTSWLELAPGVRWVPGPDAPLRSRVDAALLDTVAAAQTATVQAGRLATNAFERALLWLDAAAPGDDQLDGRVHEAIDFVARNLDQPLDVGRLAAAVSLSPSRLSHLFTEQVGTSPSRFVEQRRIERAQHLLASTSMTVGAIARATGFSSQFYFATRFKACTGSTPSAWRGRGTSVLARPPRTP